MKRFRSQRVCLWHSGRCGSTVLADLLGQDHRIVWGGELLGPYTKRIELEGGPPRGWAGAARKIRLHQMLGSLRVYGFEIKMWHLVRMGVSAGEVASFLGNQNYRHMVLERRNTLRVHFSGEVARQRREYHCEVGKERKVSTIELDLEELQSTLPKIDNFYRDLKDALPENLWLVYEDDILPDPARGYRKVLEYLGLPAREVQVRLQRTNPEPLQALVENWDHLRACLSGTTYEWMLEGP